MPYPFRTANVCYDRYDQNNGFCGKPTEDNIGFRYDCGAYWSLTSLPTEEWRIVTNTIFGCPLYRDRGFIYPHVSRPRTLVGFEPMKLQSILKSIDPFVRAEPALIFERMLRMAPDKGFEFYIMDLGLDPERKNIDLALQVLEIIGGRIEAREAEFLALSEDPRLVALARNEGIPCLMTPDFQPQNYFSSMQLTAVNLMSG